MHKEWENGVSCFSTTSVKLANNCMPILTGNFKIEVNIPRRASCFKTQSKEKTQHKITTTLVYALAISVFALDNLLKHLSL